jgi:DNA-binding XRE family transcriptional regulator
MLSVAQPVSFPVPEKKRGRPKKSPEKIAAESLGQKIKMERRAKKLSQSELAELVGFGLYRQLVGDIENGRQLPTIFQLVQIAKKLDVDLHQWLSIF